LQDIIKREKEALRLDLGKGEHVLIEFVSANPTGALSVAHARQAAVGDVLANVLEFIGFKVEREYYLNDEGNQINILGKSVELRMKEFPERKSSFRITIIRDSIFTRSPKRLSLKKLKPRSSEILQPVTFWI